MRPELLASLSEVAASAVRVAGWEVAFSAVLFVIVLGLTVALRNSAPSLRHALWGLVLLRLVLPLDLSMPFSMGALAERANLAPGFESVWPEARPAATTDQRGAPAKEGPAPQLALRERGVEAWKLAALVVWLFGALGVAVVLTRRRRSYRAVVRNASAVSDPAVLALLRRWKSELRVRRAVRLATSSHPHTPFTYGTLRPVIFLPRAVLERDEPGLLESVLAHELAHVRRWDDLLLKGQLVISALYFFNPIAWLAAGKMREESERACDELVLSRGRLTARTYGRSIVTVLKLGLACESSVAPALASRRRRLKARLEAIMVKSTLRKGGVRALYPIPAALALGLVLLPMAGTSSGAVSGGDGVTALQEGSRDQERAVVMSNPMPGARVSAAWGPMLSPFTGNKAHHRGIDLVGKPDSEIHAAAGGTVAEATADYSGGEAHGTVVILDHGNGIKTFYSHLERLDVAKGQRVAEGEVLGTQGSTGKVTGPHLHFEVWVNGEFRDPALFVSEWQSDEREFWM